MHTLAFNKVVVMYLYTFTQSHSCAVPFELFVYILISRRMRWCDILIAVIVAATDDVLIIYEYYLRILCMWLSWLGVWHTTYAIDCEGIEQKYSKSAFFSCLFSSEICLCFIEILFLGKKNVSKFLVAWSAFEMCFLGIITVVMHSQSHSTTQPYR